MIEKTGTQKKTILNSGGTDPNKILPMKYKWARTHYKNGVANNWTPEEVNMQKDVETWKQKGALSEEERRLIMWNMGFFSTAESLTANNLVLAVYRHVTNPECRQYILRQAFEEAVHTDTFIYCCDSLGLDPEEVYNMYNTVPSIEEKDAFVAPDFCLVEVTQELFIAGGMLCGKRYADRTSCLSIQPSAAACWIPSDNAISPESSFRAFAKSSLSLDESCGLLPFARRNRSR